MVYAAPNDQRSYSDADFFATHGEQGKVSETKQPSGRIVGDFRRDGGTVKAKELIVELERRNHPHLYHATTLGTFRSYVELGAYRSRASVAAAGLTLTPQVSDSTDKRLGVFDHLFLNIFDQHGDVSNGRSVTGINKYGPILMVFDIHSLARYAGPIIGYKKEITSADYSAAEHDVVTIEDFRSNTFRDDRSSATSDWPRRQPGTPGPNMCVHCSEEHGGIPFAEFLSEVVVDTLPPVHSRLQQEMLDEVKELVGRVAPDVRVTPRNCIDGCDCEYGYGNVLTGGDIRRFVYETNAHVYTKYLRRPR